MRINPMFAAVAFSSVCCAAAAVHYRNQPKQGSPAAPPEAEPPQRVLREVPATPLTHTSPVPVSVETARPAKGGSPSAKVPAPDDEQSAIASAEPTWKPEPLSQADQIAALDMRVERQPVDYVWARETERRLSEILGKALSNNSRVKQVDCRTELCAIEIDHGPNANHRQELWALGELEGWEGAIELFTEVTGEQRVTRLFVGRGNTHLEVSEL